MAKKGSKKFGSKIIRRFQKTNPKGQTFNFVKLADGRIVTVSRAK